MTPTSASLQNSPGDRDGLQGNLREGGTLVAHGNLRDTLGKLGGSDTDRENREIGIVVEGAAMGKVSMRVAWTPGSLRSVSFGRESSAMDLKMVTVVTGSSTRFAGRLRKPLMLTDTAAVKLYSPFDALRPASWSMMVREIGGAVSRVSRSLGVMLSLTPSHLVRLVSILPRIMLMRAPAAAKYVVAA